MICDNKSNLKEYADICCRKTYSRSADCFNLYAVSENEKTMRNSAARQQDEAAAAVFFEGA